MNEIIAVIGSIYIYRHGIVMGAAAAAAVACAFILARRRNVEPLAVGLMSAFALLLCPMLSRAVYWYCCPEQYADFADAMFSFGDGGHSVFGALAGAAAAVLLTKLCVKNTSLARLFDIAAPSGALCICIGRLAAFFTDDDKGRMIFTSAALQRLPFSVLVTDMATGAQEWRFATFIFESIAALIIFVVLTVLLLSSADEKQDGRTALMFAVLYGTSQIVLESTRYDSLFLRSNGFVSLMQIAGLVMMVAGIAAMSVRLVRLTGYRRVYLAYWITVLCLSGVAGFLEYYVQRHADQYTVCYPIMALCMLAVSAIAYILGVLIPNEQSQRES